MSRAVGPSGNPATLWAPAALKKAAYESLAIRDYNGALPVKPASGSLSRAEASDRRNDRRVQ